MLYFSTPLAEQCLYMVSDTLSTRLHGTAHDGTQQVTAHDVLSVIMTCAVQPGGEGSVTPSRAWQARICVALLTDTYINTGHGDLTVKSALSRTYP